MTSKILAFVVVFGLILSLGASKSGPKKRITGVELQLTTTSKSGQLHWKITNNSPSEVYVYSFFLYGPSYETEDRGDKKIFYTAPTAEDGGCPNRFPPVLLLQVPFGDYREGDFRDPELKKLSGKTVSLTIGFGPEPYTVVDEAHRIRWKSKNCMHSPYNAIFEWSTTQESNTVQIP